MTFSTDGEEVRVVVDKDLTVLKPERVVGPEASLAGLEQPKGLAIKDELEEYYESEINHGRLYPNLDTLVEKGLVEKGEVDQRTNFYELTSRGERELEARREWEEEYLEEAVPA